MVKRGHIVLGMLAAALVSAGSAEARVGGTVAQFEKTMMVQKLGYTRMGPQGQKIVMGKYKGYTAYQYKGPDLRTFIDLVVTPKGAIVEQAMLLPIQPNAMDAARFLEFLREATKNSVNMNEVFIFMSGAVKVRKDSRKQFGRYVLTAYPLAGVVVDVKVTFAGRTR